MILNDPAPTSLTTNEFACNEQFVLPSACPNATVSPFSNVNGIVLIVITLAPGTRDVNASAVANPLGAGLILEIDITAPVFGPIALIVFSVITGGYKFFNLTCLFSITSSFVHTTNLSLSSPSFIIR